MHTHTVKDLKSQLEALQKGAQGYRSLSQKARAVHVSNPALVATLLNATEAAVKVPAQYFIIIQLIVFIINTFVKMQEQFSPLALVPRHEPESGILLDAMKVITMIYNFGRIGSSRPTAGTPPLRWAKATSTSPHLPLATTANSWSRQHSDSDLKLTGFLPSPMP
jgi:hypothetical protein